MKIGLSKPVNNYLSFIPYNRGFFKQSVILYLELIIFASK